MPRHKHHRPHVLDVQKLPPPEDPPWPALFGFPGVIFSLLGLISWNLLLLGVGATLLLVMILALAIQAIGD